MTDIDEKDDGGSLPMPDDLIRQICRKDRRREKIELLNKLDDCVIQNLMEQGYNFDPDVDSDTEEYKNEFLRLRKLEKDKLKQTLSDKLKNLKLRRRRK